MHHMQVATTLRQQGFLGEDVDYLRQASGWTDTQIPNAAYEDAVIYFQQTHLGPKGKPLAVDGIVGPDTIWALKHPSGKAQKSNLEPKVPRGIWGEREEVLYAALCEHEKGVKERPNGSNRSKEIDKYLPGWWLDKNGSGVKGPAWCSFCVHWVFKEATGRYPCGSRTGSCSQLMKKAEGLLAWYYSLDGGYSNRFIRPGDIFIISHPKKPGKPKTGHTGFVLRVNKAQTVINTVEGNCGNRVKVGRRNVQDLAGFINPYRSDCQPTEFSHTLLKAPSVAGAGTR